MNLKDIVDNWFKPLCYAAVALIGVVAAWQGLKPTPKPVDAKPPPSTPGTLSPLDLKVMNDVTEAIRTNDKAAFPRLTILVATLYDAGLATRLTQALAEAGDVGAAANASAMAAFVTTNLDDGRAAIPAGTVTIPAGTVASPAGTVAAPASGAAAPGPAARPPRVAVAVPKLNVAAIATRPVDATRTLAPVVAGGWAIDVFWCQGGDDAARHARADAFARSLVTTPSPSLAGQAVGRVRVRPLPFIVNQRAGYNLHADLVRAETREQAAAQALAVLANGAGQPLGVAISSQATPNYMSAFYCA